LPDSAQNVIQNQSLHIRPYLKDITTLPSKILMFQKSHKFINTVGLLQNVVMKTFLLIYLLNCVLIK